MVSGVVLKMFLRKLISLIVVLQLVLLIVADLNDENDGDLVVDEGFIDHLIKVCTQNI